MNYLLVWVWFSSQNSVWWHEQDSLCVRCSSSRANMFHTAVDTAYRSRWEVDVKIIVWILKITEIKKTTFQPTEAFWMPCTMGLYKWVVRHKHSLAEHKSIMHSKQFWSPVTLEYFYLAKGNELKHRASDCSQTLAANLCSTSSFDEYK